MSSRSPPQINIENNRQYHVHAFCVQLFTAFILPYLYLSMNNQPPGDTCDPPKRPRSQISVARALKSSHAFWHPPMWLYLEIICIIYKHICFTRSWYKYRNFSCNKKFLSNEKFYLAGNITHNTIALYTLQSNLSCTWTTQQPDCKSPKWSVSKTFQVSSIENSSIFCSFCYPQGLRGSWNNKSLSGFVLRVFALHKPRNFPILKTKQLIKYLAH